MPVEDRYQISPSDFAHLHLGLELYSWQIEALDAAGAQKPVALAAANESGKTTFVVAPLVLWFLWAFPEGKVVITSGAFRQVSHQLWPAMQKFRDKFPDWDWLNVNIRTPEGGFAIGFTVTDAGRFEGWHPTEGADVDGVMIIVDEAKTVNEAVFAAVDRCGPQWQLFVSSPGAPAGQFYRCFKKERALYWHRKVKSTDCPHISPAKRLRDLTKYGKDHPVFLSMHEAEFGEDDNNLVLSMTRLERALSNQPKIDTSGETVAFMDFAAGRDEWVVAARKGNKARILDCWTCSDTGVSIARSIGILRKHGFHPGEAWGDADGLGKPILDRFRDEHDFYILPFHGGSAPPEEEKDNYDNMISYVWEQGCRDIASGAINVGDLDERTQEQLTDRPWNDPGGWNKRGKLQVMPKDKMSEDLGIKSPDRADALLGCIVCGKRLSGAVDADTVKKAVIPVSDFAVQHVEF